MEKNQQVKVVGGNNEIGQPTMIGKVGVIKGLDKLYYVEGKRTRVVYAEFKYFGLHAFNDYMLQKINN